MVSIGPVADCFAFIWGGIRSGRMLGQSKQFTAGAQSHAYYSSNGRGEGLYREAATAQRGVEGALRCEAAMETKLAVYPTGAQL